MNGERAKGSFFCFVGPAGAGKGFITRHLLERFPNALELAISATSRAPRSGEVEGKHYFFLSREQFQAEVDRNGFFEWEETHGNFYGTPNRWVSRVMEEQKHVLLDVDIRGALTFQRAFPDNFVGVLVLPPSLQVLLERLDARGGLSERELMVRLETAKRELQQYRELIDGEVFQYVLVNNERVASEKIVEEIILGTGEPLSAGERRSAAEFLGKLLQDVTVYLEQRGEGA